jgi:phosphopantothenate-cysteine ligase
MTTISTEHYFSAATPPTNLSEISILVETFIQHNHNRKVVLVTSGGTAVPLEKNTVRFLDNFSAGTRGAASAEAFIEKGILQFMRGYAVIFLHRQFSLEPYTRQYTHSKNCFLDFMEINGDSLVVSEKHADKMKSVFAKYQKVYTKVVNNILGKRRQHYA